MGARAAEEEEEGRGRGRQYLATDSSSSRTDYTGAASVHGALCIDKIHTPEMPACATGSVRLVS